MVVLEAFREGTPVLARRLGPFPEIIAQSEGGLLFDTVEELDSALSSLLTSESLRARLGRSAKAAAETLWSETTAMNRYFDLIGEIADKRHDKQLLEKIRRID